MSLKTLNGTPLVFAIVIASSLLMSFATTSSITQTAIAQNQSQGQSAGNAPLNFYLKLSNNQSTSQASSQAASNGTGTKNMTITVSVQKGSGNPIKLPISAIVPNNINPEDLQLCASLSNGQQMCQPLGQNAANIDLSSSANSTAKTTPQSYLSKGGNILDVSFNSIVQYADAQLISVNNTTLNIPITVIVPITLEIQNAQICASVASSGGQSCQQIVLNPTQSAFTPVNVDLSNPTTPTVTTLSAAVPTTQQLTASPTGTNETSTGTNETSTGTNDTSSGNTGTTTTSGSDAQGETNNTSDQSSTTQSNPTTTEPTQDSTDTKDKKNQDKKDSTDNSNNGNSGN